MAAGTHFAISLTKQNNSKVWYREPDIYGTGYAETSLLHKATMFPTRGAADTERSRMIRGGHCPAHVTIVPVRFNYDL